MRPRGYPAGREGREGGLDFPRPTPGSVEAESRHVAWT